jgi:hypothetical protein
MTNPTTPLPVQEPAGAVEARERARFEAWMRAQGYEMIPRICSAGSPSQGEYANSFWQAHWDVWLAAKSDAKEAALASLPPVTQPDVSIPAPGMNASGERVDSANVTQAKSEAVGDRDLALGLLCGLHPEITRDEPLEVAQQIFDHVQAERADHAREVKSLRQTIDELLRRSPATSAHAKSEAVAPKKVYLVHTGEFRSGYETYTRHDDNPPLCDSEVLYAAPQEAVERQPLTGWQPIETAPKDATAILVMRNIWPGCENGIAEECNGHNTYVAEWWAGERDGAGAWICYMDSTLDPECPIEPTHWQPLPEPPGIGPATQEKQHG